MYQIIENYVVKLKKDDGFHGTNDVKIALPSHLGAFFKF